MRQQHDFECARTTSHADDVGNADSLAERSFDRIQFRSKKEPARVEDAFERLEQTLSEGARFPSQV
jgi:hypothetical protein